MARTYAELKRRVQLLIDRDDAEEQIASDSTEVDMLDVFIANAEKKFYRSEAARIPPMEKHLEYTVAGSTGGLVELAVPGDYFESNYIIAKGENNLQTTLSRVSKERILTTNLSTNGKNLPDEFAYADHYWILQQPTQEVDFTAHYFGYLASLNTLTEDTDHWLLNNGDDLMMYWAAAEAAAYYGSLSDMMQIWEDRGQRIHDDIIEQSRRQQVSGSTGKLRRPYSVARMRSRW